MNNVGDVPTLRARLEAWLSGNFNGPFKWVGRKFQTRKQTDGYSCGTFVMNAMEHAMFQCPLLRPTEAHGVRIQHFVELAKYVLDNVSHSWVSTRRVD